MKSKVVISVKNLKKTYKLYEKPIDRLKESISITKKKYHKEFYALNDISLDIEEGSCIGIIGTNGSGKSTFLKMITGVLTPTSGEVEVTGKISALLELGIGFNMEYTGLENIYLSGTVTGFTKEEMDKKVDEIIDFADIGEFINQPVKTYSSGMFARLAFSVAISIEPEILIVDEALSVGDIKFQQKCYRKIESFKQDRTILLVTHDMGAITKFCDKVIWIEKGKLKAYGNPLEIAKKYQAYLLNYELKRNNIEGNKPFKRVDNTKNLAKTDYDLDIKIRGVESFGDKVAEITGIGIFDVETKEKLEYVLPNKKISVIIRVRNNEFLEDGIVGFTIKDRLSNIVLQTNSFDLEKEISSEKGEFLYEFRFRVPQLNTGEYIVSPAIASGTQFEHIQHNWIHDAYVFRIISENNYKLEGYLYLNNMEFNQL